MQYIVVDARQAKLISEARESVGIRDLHGRLLGYVERAFTQSELALAKQRMVSDQPRYTTEQVLDYVRSMGHESTPQPF